MSGGSRARLVARAAAAIGLLLIVAGVSGYVASDDVRFVVRAGLEEGRLLLRRRSLEQLIADPRITEPRRVRFSEVLDARRFGADSLGLAVGGTYTTFVDVGRDTLLLVLSASPRFQLTDYVWWFPVVGAVPYHGFFGLESAQREAARLARSGHDTYLRPAAAFSTLGWFSDPLFSTALSRDSVQLVETVLHELTHNTLWAPGSVAFNESLAMFVGFRGAELFFRSRGARLAADQAAARWEDEKHLAAFDAALAGSLDSLYRSGGDSAVLNAGRATLFRRARETIDGQLRRVLRVYPVDWMLTQPINNATVVASRIYHTRLETFDSAYLARNRDLRQTLRDIVQAVKADRTRDPYSAVEKLIR